MKTSYSTLGAVVSRSNAILALQALLNDLHVQQPEEAAAKAETERDRCFGLVDQRRVVQLQPFERIAQQRVLVALDRIQPGEDHRLGWPIARQLLRGRGCDASVIVSPTWTSRTSFSPVAMYPTSPVASGDAGSSLGIEVADLRAASAALAVRPSSGCGRRC